MTDPIFQLLPTKPVATDIPSIQRLLHAYGCWMTYQEFKGSYKIYTALFELAMQWTKVITTVQSNVHLVPEAQILAETKNMMNTINLMGSSMPVSSVPGDDVPVHRFLTVLDEWFEHAIQNKSDTTGTIKSTLQVLADQPCTEEASSSVLDDLLMFAACWTSPKNVIVDRLVQELYTSAKEEQCTVVQST